MGGRSGQKVPHMEKINRSQSDTFVTLYTNHTTFCFSPWDVRLVFGEITSQRTTPGDPVQVKQTGEVRMSPQHMMRLVGLLVKELERYEDSFGKIPTPPE